MTKERTSTMTTRDPQDLRRHKLRKHIPEPDKNAPEWKAFKDSVESAGKAPPVTITEEGAVIDGEWGWLAAKAFQLKTVDCIVVKDEEAALVLEHSILAQSVMTRGAGIYLLMPMLREVAAAAELRRLRNLALNRKTSEKSLIFSKESNFPSERSWGDFCERWGVSLETFKRAREVRNLLHDPKGMALRGYYRDAGEKEPEAAELAEMQTALREEFEPRLLNGDMNLWNVRSAIAGRIATKDRPKRQPLQLTLFEDGLAALGRINDFAQVRPSVERFVREAETEAILDIFEQTANEILAECARRRKAIREAA